MNCFLFSFNILRLYFSECWITIAPWKYRLTKSLTLTIHTKNTKELGRHVNDWNWRLLTVWAFSRPLPLSSWGPLRPPPRPWEDPLPLPWDPLPRPPGRPKISDTPTKSSNSVSVKAYFILTGFNRQSHQQKHLIYIQTDAYWVTSLELSQYRGISNVSDLWLKRMRSSG